MSTQLPILCLGFTPGQQLPEKRPDRRKRLIVQSIGLAIGVLATLFASCPTASARPAHRRALADYFGPMLAPKLNNCRTCHVPEKPGETADQFAESKPHNAFGARLKAVKKELQKAGKKTDIPARIEAIANEDSDGDGVPNLIELLTGHFPGDPNDKPTAAELAQSRQLLEAYRKYQAEYQWKPFETVHRPALPRVKNEAWVRNAVDAFIAAEHERRGLKPRPEAPKHVLVRRLYLDLIGLPPTREELHAFLADASPDAYEKLVDKLLASPRYGERWGRHWMDVWRYADWAGFGEEARESHRHIWHWRDWIVNSVNADKGYDQMIREMLAGDELAPTDPETLRATGFLVRQWYLFNRNVWLDNAVEHTAKAFLGITLSCARCHDHFYDPIPQQEYYQFRAFFEPYHVRTDRLPGEADLNKAGLPHAYDAFLDAKTHLFVRGNEAQPDTSKALEPAVPSVLGGKPLSIQPVALPLTAYRPDKRDFVIAEVLKESEASMTKARQALAAPRPIGFLAAAQSFSWHALGAVANLAAAQRRLNQIALAELDVSLSQVRHEALTAAIRAEQFEDNGKKDSPDWKQAATSAASRQRRQAVLEARRQALQAREALAAAAAKTRPEAAKALAQAEQRLTQAESDEIQPLTTTYTHRAESYPQAAIAYGKVESNPYPRTSTGRRLALANWIADSENPLTARVAMNHVWLRHFGSALVPTVFDFGRNGQKPTHPALLDWLAAEFMDPSPQPLSPQKGRGLGVRGWSMKHMHRLIVTSAAYRMDVQAESSNASLDPENRYLWRMNSRRMEAEAVRDAVLHVSGQLDTTMGGPDIPYGVGLTSPRRSLYIQHAAEKQMEFLYLFDAASVTECYRRTESVVPQQALALSNSSLVLAQSRRLALRLSKQTGTQPTATATAAFITAGFEQILGRPPTSEERAASERFLVEQASRLADKKHLTAFAAGPPNPVPPAADPHLRARENLIHVLMNHNEFVTIR